MDIKKEIIELLESINNMWVLEQIRMFIKNILS